jgi:hypothetical protein
MLSKLLYEEFEILNKNLTAFLRNRESSASASTGNGLRDRKKVFGRGSSSAPVFRERKKVYGRGADVNEANIELNNANHHLQLDIPKLRRNLLVVKYKKSKNTKMNIHVSNVARDLILDIHNNKWNERLFDAANDQDQAIVVEFIDAMRLRDIIHPRKRQCA